VIGVASGKSRLSLRSSVLIGLRNWKAAAEAFARKGCHNVAVRLLTIWRIAYKTLSLPPPTPRGMDDEYM